MLLEADCTRPLTVTVTAFSLDSDVSTVSVSVLAAPSNVVTDLVTPPLGSIVSRMERVFKSSPVSCVRLMTETDAPELSTL